MQGMRAVMTVRSVPAPALLPTFITSTAGFLITVNGSHVRALPPRRALHHSHSADLVAPALRDLLVAHDSDRDGKLSLLEVEAIILEYQAHCSTAPLAVDPAVALKAGKAKTCSLAPSPSLPLAANAVEAVEMQLDLAAATPAGPVLIPAAVIKPSAKPLNHTWSGAPSAATWDLQLYAAFQGSKAASGWLPALSKMASMKLAGCHASRPQASDLAWSCAGALTSMLVLGSAASCIQHWPVVGQIHGKGLGLMIGSFGTLCVLLFARPDAEAVRPWNLVVGHLLSTLLSVLFLACFGPGLWTRALTMAAMLGCMMWTDSVHPPGGALVLLAADSAVVQGLGAWFCLYPPLAVTALVLLPIAAACNWLKRNVRFDWPSPDVGASAAAAASPAQVSASPPATPRLKMA